MNTSTLVLPGLDTESLMRSALNRIRQLESEVRLLQQQTAQEVQHLCVYQSTKLIKVPLSEILYIQSESNYSRIFLASGDLYYTSRTLKSWEKEIPASGFLRCHRSYLINMKEIVEINKQKNVIVLKGGIQIPTSRRTQRKSVSVVFQNDNKVDRHDSGKLKCAVHKLTAGTGLMPSYI